MHIMTANGWRELQTPSINKATEPTAYNGVPVPYQDKFPTQSFCDCFNKLKDMMMFFDDGVRMVYAKADRQVTVDNRIAANPIKYPPPGF